MKSKMAVLYECDKPLVVEEIDVPSVLAGQVLVKLSYSGIYGSQLAEVQGKWGSDKYLPHGLGHEGSGFVVDIGTGVKKVKAGDPVVISWIEGDGLKGPTPSYYCRNQRINAGYSVTFAEYSIVSENRLFPLHSNMPLDMASIFGCAVATGYGAIIYDADVTPGSSVLVVGTGGVALCAVQFASLVNANPLIVVGRSSHKLEMARKLGATHTFLIREKDVETKIKDLMQGRGVDCAIDVIGKPSSTEFAYRCANSNGGNVVLIGIPGHEEHISIRSMDFDLGKKMRGGGGTSINLDRDFPKFENLYLSGKLQLELIITHRFPLNLINKALDLLAVGGQIGRAILEF